MAHKSVISIDIGTYKTKIVTGSYEKDNLYIEKALMIDTPRGSFADGKLLKPETDADSLSKAINKALLENRIRLKEAIITTQSSMVIRRELEIPQVKPKEMESMIKYEIEQYLPIDLNEYIIEYKVLEEKTNNKMRILIAALPKTIAEDHFNMLGYLNLEPKALDVNSNAVSKLFGLSQQINNNVYDMQNTVALIDLGHSNIIVTIVSRGCFQFSRLIPTGGIELDAAVADIYGISEKEAESQRINGTDLTALVNEAETSFQNGTIAEIISRWIDDIQRVFQYYKTRNANNSIDKIYLYGGISNLKGIAEYFENTTGVTTEKVGMLGSIVPEKGIECSNIENYLNCIGAIIRK